VIYRSYSTLLVAASKRAVAVLCESNYLAANARATARVPHSEQSQETIASPPSPPALPAPRTASHHLGLAIYMTFLLEKQASGHLLKSRGSHVLKKRKKEKKKMETQAENEALVLGQGRDVAWQRCLRSHGAGYRPRQRQLCVKRMQSPQW
jgi:hypothetical protein